MIIELRSPPIYVAELPTPSHAGTQFCMQHCPARRADPFVAAPPGQMDLSDAYEQELSEAAVEGLVGPAVIGEVDLAGAYELEARASLLDGHSKHTVHTAWQIEDPTDLAAAYTAELNARRPSVTSQSVHVAAHVIEAAEPLKVGVAKYDKFDVQPRQSSYDSTMTLFDEEYELNAY